jgi:hypothetical protein
MVDTWKMAETKFHHAETLLQIYDVPDKGKLQHMYYTGEYLTFGTVKMNTHNSDVVLFCDLVKDGLFKLIPYLEDQSETPGLCIPVRRIRETSFNL